MNNDPLSRVAVIRASHYNETVVALKNDPILKEMAVEVRSQDIPELTHADGHPNMQFMSRSLNEYHYRGGKIETHIGGPAEAILELHKEWSQDAE